MATNNYTRNTGVRCTGTFVVSNVLTDPSVVTIKILDPNNTQTTYVYGTDSQVAKSPSVPTGSFYIDVYPTVAGTWQYRFEGTGPASGAAEGSFYVPASSFS